MALQLAVYDAPGGKLIADWSSRATSCVFTTGEHGYKSLQATIPMTRAEAWRWYDRGLMAHVEVNDGGSRIWEGRLEDPALVAGGLQIGCFGYWNALADLTYTALWSDKKLDRWRPLDLAELVSTSMPDRYTFTKQNGLRISPRKNATMGTAAIGYFYYEPPDAGTRTILQVSFDYALLAPAAAGTTWRGEMHFRGGAVTLGWQQLTNSSGLVQTGSVVATGNDTNLTFRLFNTAAAAAYTGETDDVYLKITNLRVVTSTTYVVSTTLGTAIGGAGSATVTPASMTGIVVGKRLFIGNSGGVTVSESVVVTAVTSTTFTAVFAQTHLTTDTVKASLIYADRIAADAVFAVAATNPTQLANATALLQSPGFDLTNEVYEDDYPADMLTRLVKLGDNQTPPRQWEVGVYEDRRLYLRPRGSAGRAWYVNAAALELEPSLDNLRNSVYAAYTSPTNRTLRSAVTTDAASVTRYGVTRRAATTVQATDSTVASIQRDAYLADHATIIPRAGITLGQAFVQDATGGIWPAWMVRAGDTVEVRSLPATLTSGTDRLRTMRIAATSYDVMTGRLSITPEAPLPSLEGIVARRSEGL